MPKLFKLLFLIFILINSSWASLSNSVTSPDPSCIQDISDPYDPHLRILSGPNHGKCLNTALIRSVILLPPDHDHMRELSHKFRVGNLMHQDQPWIGVLNFTGVESVILQIQHGLTPFQTTHVQLRFHFKVGEELKLLGQTKKNQNHSQLIDDIIVSIQPVFPIETKKSPLRSYKKNQFVLAHRMLSTEQSINEMNAGPIKVDHVEKILLNLDDVQKMNVLFSSIFISDQDRMSSFYDRLNRNSTTEIFSILDHAVVYSNARKAWMDLNQFSLSSMNSLYVAWALWIRGLYREKMSQF
jgi:hypothetical protein